MIGKKNILIVFGTRPEAIKMVPVILELKKSKYFNVIVCVTAQHREMLDQVLSIYNIIPEYDMNIMKPGQDLFDITSKILLGLKSILINSKSHLVLVHGDTTTAMAATIASFYLKIPVAHVEAGLRTRDITSPYPEEFNRQLITRVASYNFSPTEQSRKNLLNESVSDNSIYITGNTVIDTLLVTAKKVESMEFPRDILEELPFLKKTKEGAAKRIILVTGHRRENFGKNFEEICYAIREISILYPDVEIIYPVHLNPNVIGPVENILSNISNISLIKPVSYVFFVKIMMYSYLILTDSGGIQEEAPSLNKPVLVMRNTTERIEVVTSGAAKLVGSRKHNIVSETMRLLDNKSEYLKMSLAKNPYGAGRASESIRKILEKSMIFDK
jgi:UDP-N-acetylglucosamine 2-epimerase (non-hydrolysing)